MAAKHVVKITWNGDTRSWDVQCTACDCNLKDFGSDGLAEQAADGYHNAHKTTIHQFKYWR